MRPENRASVSVEPPLVLLPRDMMIWLQVQPRIPIFGEIGRVDWSEGEWFRQIEFV